MHLKLNFVKQFWSRFQIHSQWPKYTVSLGYINFFPIVENCLIFCYLVICRISLYVDILSILQNFFPSEISKCPHWVVWPPVIATSYWHDDVIKWKHFPRYWPFVRGIHRSPVNSPHKGQWRRALMFSSICASINVWVNQSWGRWFETPSRSLWRHFNEVTNTLLFPYIYTYTYILQWFIPIYIHILQWYLLMYKYHNIFTFSPFK